MQAEHQRPPCDGLPDHLGVDAQLVADRRADQIGAVGVETFLYQQVDLAQIDDAEIDSDLFSVDG